MSSSLETLIQKIICTLCIIINAIIKYRDLSNWRICLIHFYWKYSLYMDIVKKKIVTR